MIESWAIPHPGTAKWVPCESFEQAMEQWFEGWNVPIKLIDGKPEPFEDSHKRVTDYHAGRAHQQR